MPVATRRPRFSGPRVVAAPRRNQLEAINQRAVVAWLRSRDVWFFHPPNGQWLRGGVQAGVRLKSLGVSAGVPDIIIPELGVATGKPTAFEMKAPGKLSRTTPEQKAWLARLASFGWVTAVYDSAESAIEDLMRMGY